MSSEFLDIPDTHRLHTTSCSRARQGKGPACPTATRLSTSDETPAKIYPELTCLDVVPDSRYLGLSRNSCCKVPRNSFSLRCSSFARAQVLFASSVKLAASAVCPTLSHSCPLRQVKLVHRAALLVIEPVRTNSPRIQGCPSNSDGQLGECKSYVAKNPDRRRENRNGGNSILRCSIPVTFLAMYEYARARF